jgi:histone H3/H4
MTMNSGVPSGPSMSGPGGGGTSGGDPDAVPAASGVVFSGESKSMPKDAQVIVAILKDMGISEWEPRVINQLLEYVYRYVTSVLDDAKAVSGHARKKLVDVEDVRLAVQMYTEQNTTSPPSRDVLLDVARAKNSATLPLPKATSGLRLPPDRFCLTSCNYRFDTETRLKILPVLHHAFSWSGCRHATLPGSLARQLSLKNKFNNRP